MAKKLKKKGVVCGMMDGDLAVNVEAKDKNNVTSGWASIFIVLSKV